MTPPLDEALKGDENVVKGDINTLHCEKVALIGNKDAVKCDGNMLRGDKNAIR